MTIEDLRFDFDLLLADVLKMNRASLYAHGDKNLSIAEIESLKQKLIRRLNGEPFAYIVGHKAFMDLDLMVNENVLIPRPETEILVESVIERLKQINEPIKIADIGTGSGAIALSIKKYLPNAQVHAIDISQKALEVARQNSIKNNLPIEFHHGDLFEPIKDKKFQAIVSNPPYIPSDVVTDLEVSKFEPRLALDGGIDGLNFYRRLIAESESLLTDEGFLAFEIGFNQAEEIKILAQDKFKIEIIKDLANLNRVMILTR